MSARETWNKCEAQNMFWRCSQIPAKTAASVKAFGLVKALLTSYVIFVVKIHLVHLKVTVEHSSVEKERICLCCQKWLKNPI